MSDTATEPEELPEKRSKMPLILGLVAALVGGGGGFFAAFSGMILPSDPQPEQTEQTPEVGSLPDVAFIPVDPIIVSMGGALDGRFLQFRAQLEVPTKFASDVEAFLPRVTDVLNGYLRALEAEDIENASSLMRLRAQMLHRVQIIVGTERVNDLLVMEFVVN